MMPSETCGVEESFTLDTNIVLYTIIIGLLGYIWKDKYWPSPSSKPDELPSKQAVLSLIKARRSIMPKDFEGDIMSEDDIEYLLEAGNWAPTHHKTEPWRYVVVSGRENILDYMDFLEDWYSKNRESISEEDLAKFTQKISALKGILPTQASHLFVICMKRQALPDKLVPEWEEMCATACSVQNIHLALTALPGWGGFWSSHTWCKHAREDTQFKEYLGLEPEDRVLGAFMLGKVKDGKTFRSTRNSWRNKVIMRTTR